MTILQLPFGAVPSENQMAWHSMQYYAFVHFGPNTFSGEEWGSGRERPEIFNPKKLDCRQWARAFREAGMSGVIITAKHHDGFCLWPSNYSKHTVAQSAWRDGKGDVLAELATACKAEGLKMGVYLSPWDRNHPSYGTPKYNQVFAKMLEEVLTQYGDIFEVWFDGANGEGPNGKRQEYDWDLFIRTVRKYQPKAVIFGDAFDIRWVGNESGIGSETNWATLDRSRYFPGTPLHAELGAGMEGGSDYCPAEADVSIRPGWFWRKAEDDKVKSPSDLLKIYDASIGRGCNLLLNVPPNSDGLISEPDYSSLIGFRRLREWKYSAEVGGSAKVYASSGTDAFNLTDGSNETYWVAPSGKYTASVLLQFETEPIIAVGLREFMPLGQRIKKFSLEAEVNSKWIKIGSGTTIGYNRIIQIGRIRTGKIRLNIEDSLASPALAEVLIYADPNQLQKRP